MITFQASNQVQQLIYKDWWHQKLPWCSRRKRPLGYTGHFRLGGRHDGPSLKSLWSPARLKGDPTGLCWGMSLAVDQWRWAHLSHRSLTHPLLSFLALQLGVLVWSRPLVLVHILASPSHFHVITRKSRRWQKPRTRLSHSSLPVSQWLPACATLKHSQWHVFSSLGTARRRQKNSPNHKELRSFPLVLFSPK